MKITKLLIIVLSIVFLSACMTFTKLNTPQIKEFKKDMKAQYSQIADIEIKYSVPSLNIIYSFNKGISQKEEQEIFYKTKELLIRKDFQEDFFKRHLKKYPPGAGEQKVYPTAYMHFDIDNNGTEDYRYYSSYYTDTYDSSKKNEIDGYKTWEYLNSKTQEHYIVPNNQ